MFKILVYGSENKGINKCRDKKIILFVKRIENNFLKNNFFQNWFNNRCNDNKEWCCFNKINNVLCIFRYLGNVKSVFNYFCYSLISYSQEYFKD